MAGDQIKFEKRDNLGLITLNRPEARNALNSSMVEELGRAIRFCDSPEVRAVLLSGTGGAFCAGGDVKDFVEQFQQGGAESLSSHVRNLADTLHKDVILGLRRLAKPVVASINGVAAGAGFSLMLACDIRIASRDARFLMAYANIGTTADGGSTYLLPRLVGNARAMELYLASQPMSAEVALEKGLVSQVCTAQELEQHALETVHRLAQGPTSAYGRFKALIDQSWHTDLETHLDAETGAISEISLTHDFQEGTRAFIEKRQPRFTGQ